MLFGSRSVYLLRLGVSELGREQKLCFAVRDGDGDDAVENKSLGEKIPFDVVDSHVMGRTGVASIESELRARGARG